jgi:hypothetical protein
MQSFNRMFNWCDNLERMKCRCPDKVDVVESIAKCQESPRMSAFTQCGTGSYHSREDWNSATKGRVLCNSENRWWTVRKRVESVSTHSFQCFVITKDVATMRGMPLGEGELCAFLWHTCPACRNATSLWLFIICNWKVIVEAMEICFSWREPDPIIPLLYHDIAPNTTSFQSTLSSSDLGIAHLHFIPKPDPPRTFDPILPLLVFDCVELQSNRNQFQSLQRQSSTIISTIESFGANWN